MRKLLITGLILAAIVAGAAFYLIATTPSGGGIAFPLDAKCRAMIAHVPESAEAFALVPGAAALDAKLRANPVTRNALESWTAKQQLPRPWMIGDADLLAWRNGEGRTRYYLRLDPLRALLVRAYVMIRGDIGNTIVINAPAEEPINAADRDAIIALAGKLPAGDALVVQRVSSRGAYPPIARPAVSSVRVAPNEIDVVSRAASTDPASGPLAAHFDDHALLSTSFSSPPRLVHDLDRLVGGDVAALFDNGGEIAIYDIETGKLLPRPICVFVLPDDAQRAAALDRLQSMLQAGSALGVRPRVQRYAGRLLLSFDDSVSTYINDAPREAGWPSARWAVRLDPSRLGPIASKLSSDIGLRIAAPRVFRSARDADRWIAALQQAKSIDAIDATDGAAEELRVAIK